LSQTTDGIRCGWRWAAGAKPGSAPHGARWRNVPQLRLAHWLAATVFVARSALGQAERDVDRALAVAAVESPEAAMGD